MIILLTILFLAAPLHAAEEKPAQAKNEVKASATENKSSAENSDNRETASETNSPQEEGTPTVNKKEIQQFLNVKDDPSMLLEPPPPEEVKKEKPKPPPPPAPPTPPVPSLGNNNNGLTTLFQTPGKEPSSKGKFKLGRVGTDSPAAPEVSIILVDDQFFPSRIRMKNGNQTKLYFTTINERPAAIVVEKVQIQRWLNKEEGAPKSASEYEKAKFEITREVGRNKVIEIIVNPIRGNYSFHDVISGARGQIFVD